MDKPPIQPWTSGPPIVRAHAGVIDLWQADLEAIGDRPEQLPCPAELARAARIVPARKRVLWARSRGVLRALLGRYLDRDPRALHFVLGPHGKPALSPAGPTRAEAGPARDLRFNLSHSGGLALVAVTVGREVGVDVERTRARYTAEFLRGWVANEAAVKCLGTGLGQLGTGCGQCLGLAESRGMPRDQLWTAQLDVGPGAIAAVAVDGGPCELRCRDWRG